MEVFYPASTKQGQLLKCYTSGRVSLIRSINRPSDDSTEPHMTSTIGKFCYPFSLHALTSLSGQIVMSTEAEFRRVDMPRYQLFVISILIPAPVFPLWIYHHQYYKSFPFCDRLVYLYLSRVQTHTVVCLSVCL